MSLFSASVVLRKRGAKTGEDEYGRPIYGPHTETVSRAWFEPGTHVEDVRAREQYISGYTVYLPLTADLAGADEVELAGVPGVFQVVGEVGIQPSGFVVEGYQVAHVERVTG